MKKYLHLGSLIVLLLTAPTLSYADCNTNILAEMPSSRFTTNSDGTVTDKKFGLVWMKCAVGQSGSNCSGTPSIYDWEDSNKYGVGLSFAGENDWRLPNIKELASIVETRCSSPSINEAIFPNTPTSRFWTSTPSSDSEYQAWIINYADATEQYDSRSDSNHIRLVRGGNERVIELPEGLDVLEVATGISHACAILADKTVKCWGSNSSGQLGNGTTVSSSAPVLAIGVSNAVGIDVGRSQSCAVSANGTIKCWGDNYYGGLGNGTIDNLILIPTPVTGISTAAKVGINDTHGCALLANGTAKCWGSNGFGQLGSNITSDSTVPVSVSGLGIIGSDAVDIAVNNGFNCALLQNGDVTCWGRNGFGQLGDGTYVNKGTPNKVPSLANIVKISHAGGGSGMCVVTSSGQVKCWGCVLTCSSVQAERPNTPFDITGISNPVSLGIGGIHACALLGTGHIKCWGKNYNGNLGNGTYSLSSLTPVQVSDITNASQINVGNRLTCATLTTGEVKCWGINYPTGGNMLQIPDDSSPVPVKINGF